MVKNEQNLHLKHPHGELAVDGVVKKFTIKKGVSINMARKTKNDTLKYPRGNERVERNPHSRGYVHNLAEHHEYLESMREPLKMCISLGTSVVRLNIFIEPDDAKEVDIHDSK